MNKNPPHPYPPARPERPIPQSWALWSYRVATALARPAAGTILRLRERRGKEDPTRRQERFGIATATRPDGILFWVHAASVGEAMVALPLVIALHERRPDAEVLLTTGTVTSAQLVASRLPAGVRHQFLPLDAGRYVRRFLDHWRPDLAILTEQEIWPNHVLECARRGIPLALVNARMSTASYVRWRRRRHLARELFGRFDLVLAQNETLAARLRALGAPNVAAAGNLKVDAPPLPVDQAEVDRLRAELAGRPFWLAASTHPGEEDQIAGVHRALTGTGGSDRLCTLIVPRHPERGVRIAEELAAGGLTVALRSRGERIGPQTDVYVADSIGELGTFYALTPIAFIGGSLVQKGGQNPIEAIRHSAAVLTGPHHANFEDAFNALIDRGGVVEAADGPALARQVGTWLRDAEALDSVRRRAEQTLGEMSGALARSVEALLPLLPKRQEPARASA